jgi:DNA-binding LytR/AlgR family response regulator
MKISCIAVDDEPLALEKMATYIAKVDYLDLKGTFDNAFDALNFLRQERVDLMFLDIQMDELTGIQLLEVLKNQPKVVLTTAYDQYALRGYELDVVDYLLKPFSYQRFLKAAEKVFEGLRQTQQAAPPSPTAKEIDFILVRSEYRLQKIKLADIQYIEGMKDYSRIFTPDNKIMTLQNLKKLEEGLPSPPFLRVHKSFIISVDRVESIGKNDIVVAERTIPIGGLYKKTFMDYLDEQKLLG